MTAEARALEYTPVSAAALAELRAAQQRGSAITGPGPYADILAPQPNRDDDRELGGDEQEGVSARRSHAGGSMSWL